MKSKQVALKLKEELDHFISGQSVDCVIIGFEQQSLKILVLKLNTKEDLWVLPGGFIFRDEDLDKAAIRVLKQRTGLELPYLEQFKTFGKANRRDSKTLKKHLESYGLKGKITEWFSQRFITTCYLSLVDIEKYDPKAGPYDEKAQWVSIDELPDLIFDHAEIVKTAVEFVKNQINYLPIGITLLPEKFTMKQLQNLYEAILGKKLDRGNFQRKMLKFDIFNRHEKQLAGGAHKAPYLYSFDQDKYKELLDQGFGFFN